MNVTTQRESELQETLDDYGLPSVAQESGIQDLVALAAQVCAVPFAGVALVTPDEVVFPVRIGPGPGRLPRGNAACELAVRSEGVLEIADTRLHPMLQPAGPMSQPAGVAEGLQSRIFFAAVPLESANKVRLGFLFVQDVESRILQAAQRRGLEALARQVMARFELKAKTLQIQQTAERKLQDDAEAQTALLEQQLYTTTMLDTVGALVMVFDTRGRIVRFNRCCELTSGYRASSIHGRFLWEKLIAPEDVPEMVATLERLRAGQVSKPFETVWRHQDGSQRRIAWSARPLPAPEGGAELLIATGTDVTLQREAEHTLRDSEARYRQLIEGSLGLVFTHDPRGKLLSVNTLGAESLGYHTGEMERRNLLDFVPEHGFAAARQYLQGVMATGAAQGRLSLLHQGGEERIFAFRNRLITPEPGEERYVLGFAVDVTEQVVAEKKLHAVMHQSNSILESVGDGIYGIDLDGCVTMVNPAAAQMLGYTPEELLGTRIHDRIHSQDADGKARAWEDCPIRRAIVLGDTVRAANEIFRRKDGTSFPVEYVARPQRESASTSLTGQVLDGQPAQGRPIGAVVAFLDTTARQALDRMKDEFISTVSHELRTPLTSLRAALGLVTGGVLDSQPERMRQMLEIAIGNTDRLIRLVNDILDIDRLASGSALLKAERLSAQHLLEQAVAARLHTAEKAGVQLRMEACGAEVWADREMVLQALDNLLSNAIKFSATEGEVLLSAHPLENGHTQFNVRDHGQGIPEDRLESIFERFQQVDASDSRARGGTGLGLAICRHIVRQHGGKIWAASTPGQGSSFHFTLPSGPAA